MPGCSFYLLRGLLSVLLDLSADVTILPDPLDARISRKEEQSRWVAGKQHA